MSLTIYIFLICFLALPYFIIYLRNLIWDVYLWQVKEYRFDRIFSQLLYEKVHGVRSMPSLYFKIGLLTLIVVFFISNNSDFLLFFSFLAFFLYWYESMDFFPKLIRKKLHRPDIRSPRNLILITGTVLILILPFLWLALTIPNPINNSLVNTDNVLSPSELARELAPYQEEGILIYRPEYLIIFWSSVFGIMGEIVSPLYTALLVIVTRPIAYAKRRNILSLARAKLAQHANVKVIAVTGSYGKSTTKEILYQLLSPFYETIKTEKNNNTDVGIAQTILKKLNKDTEVFIAEMGAYKLGETRDCCLIAPPNIAIITGIDQQHLSLYGSIKAILDSTYEVVEYLSQDGLVIFNGDNEYCLKLAERTRTRKQFYFTVDSVEKLVAHNYDHKIKMESGHEYPAPDNISVSEVKETAKGLQLRLKYRDSEYLLKTSFKAQYNVANLMAAILVAMELGVPLDKLTKVINETDFHVPYLNTLEGRNGVKVIDDGYNANFTGFMAALRFLKEQQVKGEKVIFTQGVIELGKERDAVYKQLAKAITESANWLYTTDRDLLDAVKEQDFKFKQKRIYSVFDFPIYFKERLHEGDLLLIEGPFPQEVLKQIYQKYP